VKIRLLVWCEGYVPARFDSYRHLTPYWSPCHSEFNDFVLNEVNKDKLLQSFEKDNPFNEMKDFVFDLPDNFDEQFIIDICVGRSFTSWLRRGIDLSKNYYRSWVFIEKNNKWELQKNIF